MHKSWLKIQRDIHEIKQALLDNQEPDPMALECIYKDLAKMDPPTAPGESALFFAGLTSDLEEIIQNLHEKSDVLSQKISMQGRQRHGHKAYFTSRISKEL